MNAIEPVSAPDALRGAKILVGAYAGKHQWFHAYDRDARSHIARYEWKDVAHYVDSQRIEREAGFLLVKIENQKEQAFPAGFKSSELVVSVFDARGRTLFDKRIRKAGKEVAVTESVLVLGEEPLRFLVGYGDRVLEYTEQ